MLSGALPTCGAGRSWVHGDAALIAYLAINYFGCFRMDVHPISGWRVCGVLLVGGVTLIAKF